ncbi:hypothetical protein [Flavobacterium sp. CS20]|jgi:hypothetical protein|uniref:hypothetical protein n=1 Tax=Flavobacterium sp. CS20 TaxID=2775246 RepID=UPI001B39E939|nr:hypothetical protein [Flavobacterium sp. CS20]QTY26881.1 hypothetical protein IGB25_13610 [Flavobacterium sp. CS20]
MDIQATKLQLVKTILENENSEFILKIADFVSKEKADFWNKLNTSEQQEIKQGIQELNDGERVSYQSFLKKIS